TPPGPSRSQAARSPTRAPSRRTTPASTGSRLPLPRERLLGRRALEFPSSGRTTSPIIWSIRSAGSARIAQEVDDEAEPDDDGGVHRSENTGSFIGAKSLR